MYKIKDIIISILEEDKHEISIQPINFKFANNIVMALVIPKHKSELVLEVKNSQDSIVIIDEYTKFHNTSSSLVTQKTTNFNLAHPSEYDDLRSYLYITCHNHRTEVEFEDVLATSEW